MKKTLYPFFIFIFLLGICCFLRFHVSHPDSFKPHAIDYSSHTDNGSAIEVVSDAAGQKKYIKWVDFNVSYEALCLAYDLDVESYASPVHLNWVELLAYAAAKSGGTFNENSLALIKKLAKELSDQKVSMEDLTRELKYYPYYLEAYNAILGGMVGEYEIEQETEGGTKSWKKVYGLKAFSPIAKGFPYSDYDDFGSSRSYGYKRQHLGHDMMGQIGTPI